MSAPAAPAPAATPAPAPASSSSSSSKPAMNPVWAASRPFVFGGMSGMVATCCVQPIDMVKVRIQSLGEGGGKVSTNPFRVAGKIVSEEGVLALYKGLSAGLLRQATYTTARMGIFRTVSNSMTTPGQPLPFYKKTIAGLTAGAIGSVFGTPCDLALIRMQTDAVKPLEQRKNYKNVFDALARIAKEEGVTGLWRGNVPVVARAMSLNVGQLAINDEVMDILKTMTTNAVVISGGAKLASGFCASAFSLPFDFIKTRMQKQVPDKDGKVKYRNLVHCGAVVAREEGFMAFYRGFWTYYVRIAPHAMITLFALEQMEAFAKSHGF